MISQFTNNKATNKPGQREPVRGPLPKGNVQRFARAYIKMF